MKLEAMPYQKLFFARATSTSMQVMGGAFLLALAAHIKIPLPYTPVPLSPQTLTVLLLGGTLGSKKGAASVLLYILFILMGAPILVGTYNHPLTLTGLTGGYIFGFVVQGALFGALLEQQRSDSRRGIFFAATFCSLIQLCLGTLWLSLSLGLKQGVLLGFVPFVGSELLKSFVATLFFSPSSKKRNKPKT